MSSRTYINVILPIKLGWEPLYAVEGGENVEVGDRVAVPFAGRYALGVVSAVGVALPDGIREESVKAIHGVNRSKAKLLPTEIEFFRMVGQYYMCSVGEVYKAAYPMVKDETVRKRKAKDAAKLEGSMSVEMDERGSACLAAILQTMKDAASGPAASAPKSVLCDSGGDIRVLAGLALESSHRGNVLWLVPELKLGKSMEDCLREVFGDRLIIWGSTLTPAKRRDATERVRGGEPYILLGTRSALFLPHHDLSLVLVQDEHEASYKQSSPAPRYNGRDAAVMLGALHKAQVVLESHTPSLESIYNCLSGKYLQANTIGDTPSSISAASPIRATQIVDIRAELRKRGMVGDISRKLIAAAQGRKCAVYKPRRAMFPKMEELMPQVESTLGSGCFVTDDLIDRPLPPDTEVLAVLGVDSMLGRADFRADEKVFQTIMQAADTCRDSLRLIVIQTRESSHPVFKALESRSSAPLLAERQEFGFPPFSRIVDICINDSFPDRAARMASALASRISTLGICTVIPGPSGLRIMLEKGRYLTSRKTTLVSVVADFERESRYAGHIHFDVDPL